MKHPAADTGHYDVASYFGLVEKGLLSPDDRTELLEGLVVAMAPQNPAHAATVWRISARISALVGDRAIVRSQLPLLAGSKSVPEPDLAVVPYRKDEWQRAHPDRCLLAIEVADASLPQDRLTKSRIYAAARIDDYWIANLRTRAVEWFSAPDPELRIYATSGVATGSMTVRAGALGIEIVADELFPPLVDEAV
jgi:Uma2 family endonuclease